MTNKTEPSQAVLTEDGFEIVSSGEIKPFIDWEDTPILEGTVGMPRQIATINGTQDVVTVGDYTVGISAGLRDLPFLQGRYVRIKFLGRVELMNGRTFKKFTVLARKEGGAEAPRASGRPSGRSEGSAQE